MKTKRKTEVEGVLELFQPWGEIIVESGKIRIVPDLQQSESLEEGVVYLWVQCTSRRAKGSYFVRYVGRANKTFKLRASQHVAGLNNDVSIKAAFIRKILTTTNDKLLVYVRCSKKTNPFKGIIESQIKVSVSYVEEVFLIRYFKELYNDLPKQKQLWNEQRKPSA